MNNYVQTLYQKLLDDIQLTPDLKKIGVKNPTAIGMLVMRTVQNLKDHFKTNGFKSDAEEIHFFKYDKPLIVAEAIYAQELYTIESNKPIGNKHKIEQYYTRELGYLRRTFNQYRFLYQYYQLDGIEFDRPYFTRGDSITDVSLPVAPDCDPEFSTPGEFLFARFIALERLQDFIADLLYRSNLTGSSVPLPVLKWTGDKINLIELAYGLFDSAQINDGTCSIADIVTWLENSFGVRLTRYFQMFSEIRNRKSLSKSRFLDHMVRVLNLHAEQGEAFVPEKPKPVTGSKSINRK